MPAVITENILDVTILDPRQKHPTIFVRFDELEEGETLVVLNDHDPKPLYYQMLSERGNVFNWEYEEEGPVWWKVRITKKISGENEETLGQLAAKDLRKAEVFKKYGIDFCCGGKKTLKQACAEKGLEVTKVEQELQQADKMPSTRPIPYGDWSLDFLADYIVNTHHSYVLKSLPDLRTYASKVKEVHGSGHPELNRIHQLVEEINAELLAHMVKEERVLFPYIKELIAAQNNTQPLHAAYFGTVNNPINMMEMEHEVVGESLAEIRELSQNYLLPDDACTTYRLLYRLLQEFEEDIHLHIHLENNILFPKAIDLEKQLN